MWVPSIPFLSPIPTSSGAWPQYVCLAGRVSDERFRAVILLPRCLAVVTERTERVSFLAPCHALKVHSHKTRTRPYKTTTRCAKTCMMCGGQAISFATVASRPQGAHDDTFLVAALTQTSKVFGYTPKGLEPIQRCWGDILFFSNMRAFVEGRSSHKGVGRWVKAHSCHWRGHVQQSSSGLVQGSFPIRGRSIMLLMHFRVTYHSQC